MSTRIVLAFLTLASAPRLLPVTTGQPEPTRRGTALPNIVLLLVDDLGYGDLPPHEPLVSTPHIDSLAASGVTLERFYVAPVCTPTRAALLTGRYAMRWGMEQSVIDWTMYQGMPRDEELLPEMLEELGYTSRIVGKWHLGHRYSKFHPIEQGFDGSYGSLLGSIEYWTKQRDGQPDWRSDFAHEPIYSTPALPDPDEYHTEQVAREAQRFLLQAPEPFFLYVPFQGVHGPNVSPDGVPQAPFFGAGGGLVGKYQGLLGPGLEGRAVHLAQVESVDAAVDTILGALASRGVEEDTIVWFLSDNGADPKFAGSNGPLKGGKGQPYEGGIRVPSIVRYPRLLTSNVAGSVDTLVSHVDVVPTLRAMLAARGAVSSPALNPLDGTSVLAYLDGDASTPPPSETKYHFVYRDQFRDDGIPPRYGAVRQDPDGSLWKLVWTGARFDPLVSQAPGAMIHVYDLDADPGETNDLYPAATQPLQEVQDDLIARLGEWLGYPDVPEVSKPPSWSASYPLMPLWDFEDRPTACNTHYLVYRPTANAKQRLGILEADGTLTKVCDLTAFPDGFADLSLGGIGRHPDPSDGLIYAIDRAGTELYQLDACRGRVLRLGGVQGIPPRAAITAGDVHPGGEHFLAFDDVHDVLYAIELGDLWASAVPLSGLPGPVDVQDFALDGQGRLLAFDGRSQRILVVTLTPAAAPPAAFSGIVTSTPFQYDVQEPTGAAWVDAKGRLLVYQRKAGPAGGKRGGLPGLRRLNPVTGTTTHVQAGPPLWSLDGAGSFGCSVPRCSGA